MTDADKLAQAKELLQRMIVSAECFTAPDHTGDQVVTSYKVKTGALHQLVPLLGCYLLSSQPVAMEQKRATGATVSPFGQTVVDHLAAALGWMDSRRGRLHHDGCSVHAPSARCNCGLHKALTGVRAAFNLLAEHVESPTPRATAKVNPTGGQE